MSRNLENDMDDINVRFPNLNLSRRQLLAGLASAGAGGAATRRPTCSIPAPRDRRPSSHRAAAIHGRTSRRHGAGRRGPTLRAGVDTPQVSLDQMDSQGVATSILSLSTPGTWFGSVQDGRKMSRLVNEYAAQMGRDHPGRFGLVRGDSAGSRYRWNAERNRNTRSTF